MPFFVYNFYKGGGKMAYTAQQIFDIAMDLMSKRSISGTIDTTKTKQYNIKTPSILTIWQNGISKNGELFKEYEFSNEPVKNLLGDQFANEEFEGTDLAYETQEVAKAYYFEVDGAGTVYIEDYTTDWNIKSTITVPNTVTTFTAYKGVITPTTGATKTRIRFSGTYFYRFVNFALFSQPFSASRVPNYKQWVKFTMPSDFKLISQIIAEDADGYNKLPNYKWEGKNNLYIDYNFDGNIRIVYKPIPTKITSLTDSIEVDDITAMSGAYFLATHLLLVESPDEASFFNSMYEDLKKESIIKQPASITEIVDVY
jgi:hypothetical protein